MSIEPIQSTGAPEPAPSETAFDDAVKNARENADFTEAEEQIFTEGVAMMMQTVLSPRMSEILSEASAEE